MTSRRLESDLPAAALASIQAGTMRYTYKGVPCLKNPFDLSLYTRLICELQPRTVIEVGSAAGGSALWFADALRSHGIAGTVLSLDLNPVLTVSDQMVTFLSGDALRLGDVLTEDLMNTVARPLLVIEDAAHTLECTAAVLSFFARYLRRGEYIVIEDGIVNDLEGPVYEAYENGPNRAIVQFLQQHPDFDIDTAYCDYYGHNFTWCTNGYLFRR